MRYESTPHARGSTYPSLLTLLPPKVYPACAGIHLKQRSHTSGEGGLPRMRGDPPSSGVALAAQYLSTPHARGSTVPGM